jgi:serine protease Do
MVLFFLCPDHVHGAAQDQVSEKVASCIGSVTRQKTPAVVRIRSVDRHGELNGTGFYIDPSGLVCTVAELVAGCGDVSVVLDGNPMPAKAVAVDTRSGVAFLKIEGTNNSSCFLTPGTRTNATLHTPVIGIGIPRDQGTTGVLGMVSGNVTHEGERFFCVPQIEASIPMSEGEAGAPILDLSGSLLGMVITGNTQSGTCRFLPAGAIAKLHKDFLRYGRFQQAWVGTVVEEAAVPQGNSRTRIVSVEPESPADKAGLRPGDIILGIGSNSICNPEDVLGASFYLTAGESVNLTLLRAGNLKKVGIRCGEYPDPATQVAEVNQTPVVGQVNP